MPIVEKKTVVKTKKVNINAVLPVRDVTPPVYGVKNNVEMTISDILKCLCRRAVVHQVLSDGTTIRLTTNNFREDFEGQLQEKKKQDNSTPINGSIFGMKMHEDLDEPDEDDNAEPDEPANTYHKITTDNGDVLEVVGKDPDMVDPEDDKPDEPIPEDDTPDLEETTNDVPEKEITSDGSHNDVEKATSDEPEVSTHLNEDKPDNTKIAKKKSNKKK